MITISRTNKISFADAWVGPKLTKPKLSPDLQHIKPKNCKVIFRTAKAMKKLYGEDFEGIHTNGPKQHVITARSRIEKESMAHEFGHAALNHRSEKNRTMALQVRREINAWQWAYDNWAKPFKTKTGTLTGRAHFITQVGQQTIGLERMSWEDVLPVIESQMKVAKMPPLTPSKKKFIVF